MEHYEQESVKEILLEILNSIVKIALAALMTRYLLTIFNLDDFLKLFLQDLPLFKLYKIILKCGLILQLFLMNFKIVEFCFKVVKNNFCKIAEEFDRLYNQCGTELHSPC